MTDIFSKVEALSSCSLFENQLSGLSSLKLRKVEAVKIYYCFSGRNAWHTKWAKRYAEDCMHITIESAKNHAELLRVQGSQFTIEELPAIQLDAGNFMFFVTQINSSCPLREYYPQAQTKNVAHSKKQIANARDNYLTFGAPMEGVVLSFEHDSRFWLAQQPPSDSVIILYTASNTLAAQLKTTQLKAWQSRSRGKGYKLVWDEIDNKVSQRSILRICKTWKPLRV